MSEYKKVNVLEYVMAGLANGTLVPRYAEKYARICARPGVEGEKITSWSVDDNGNEIVEKVATVTRDEQTGNTGWVVTKLDENFDIVVDNNGHINEWIIDDSTFKRKYELDNANGNVYKPTGGIQSFVQIQEDITIFQWGQEMNIAKGGYINITDGNDMYAISERDFNDTYKFVDDDPKTKKLS